MSWFNFLKQSLLALSLSCCLSGCVARPVYSSYNGNPYFTFSDIALTRPTNRFTQIITNKLEDLFHRADDPTRRPTGGVNVWRALDDLSDAARGIDGPEGTWDKIRQERAARRQVELQEQLVQQQHNAIMALVLEKHKYRLKIIGAYNYRANLIAPERATIDVSAQAILGVIEAKASYVLETNTGRKVLSGAVYSTASYDRLEQEYANLKARERASMRAGEDLAEQIHMRLMAWSLGRP